MKTLLMAGLLAWFGPLWASTCPSIGDERVFASMQRIANLVQTVHGLAGLPDPELQNWRMQLSRRDPQLAEIGCRMLTEIPTLEAILEEAEAQLTVPGFQLPQGRGQGEALGECMTLSEYEVVRGIKLALDLVSDGLDIACRFYSCVSFACVGPCTARGIVDLSVLPFDTLVALDQNSCSNENADLLNAWAETTLGVQLKSGTALNLSEIRTLSGQSLNPLIVQTQQRIGRLGDFEAVEEELAEGLQRLRSDLDLLGAELGADIDRRDRFQTDLEVLQMQAHLGNLSLDLPLILSLPAAQGGRLEALRENVADAINGSLAIGLPLGDAVVQLRAGDVHYAAGRFLDAASAYRDAYRELLP